jgi:hypothetical protein
MDASPQQDVELASATPVADTSAVSAQDQPTTAAPIESTPTTTDPAVANPSAASPDSDSDSDHASSDDEDTKAAIAKLRAERKLAKSQGKATKVAQAKKDGKDDAHAQKTKQEQPALNVVDNNYPKSTALYLDLCKQFGEDNVVKIPKWLSESSDQSRVTWYKSCHGNSLLYFLHKSPKYKANIQAMLDQGDCITCNSYDQFVGKKLKLQTGCTCCLSLCVVPCGIHWLCMPGYELLHNVFYGSTRPQSNSMPFAPFASYDCNCMLHGEFRTDFFNQLERAGFKVNKPQYPCLWSCCCPCLAAMQAEAILNYYSHKRYGAEWKIDHITTSGEYHYGDFYNRMVGKEYSDRYKNPYGYPSKRESMNYRYTMTKGGGHRGAEGTAPYRAFEEWADLEAHLETFNTRWGAYHTIKGPLKVTME